MGHPVILTHQDNNLKFKVILNQFISTFAQISPCITLAAVRSLKNYCIKYARIWVSLRAFLEPLYFFQKRIMFIHVAWAITNFDGTGDTVDLTEVWLKVRDQEETRLLTLQGWANIFSVQKYKFMRNIVNLYSFT